MNVGMQISHYLLKEKIGEGGFGDVFLAQDLRTGQELALKCSRKQDNQLPDMHQRFLREVACAIKLNHPNIVKTYEHGSLPDGTLFIVMEYIRGQDLDDVIKDEAPFSFERATKIFLQVLDALQVAHSQGIVHRDLKPANIMLAQHGQYRDIVKLLDFGIAKAFDGTQPDLTRQNLSKEVGFGTPQYMAPEQIFGGKIGPFSDLYSAGLLYYEMLCSTQPMLAPTLSEIIFKQLKEIPKIPPPYDQGPLNNILLRAFSKDVSMRYDSAIEMRSDIMRIFDKQPEFLAAYELASLAHDDKQKLSDISTSVVDSISVDNDPTVDTNAMQAEFIKKPVLHDEATMALDLSNNDPSLYDEELNTTDFASLSDDFTKPQISQAPIEPTKTLPPPLKKSNNIAGFKPPYPVNNSSAPIKLDSAEPSISGIQTGVYEAGDPNIDISDINTSLVVPDSSLRELYQAQFAQQVTQVSPEFHQNRTKILTTKNLYRRRTSLNTTRFHSRFMVTLASSKLWRKIYTSNVAKKFRKLQLKRKASDLLEELYIHHFPALLAIICLITLIFVVTLFIIFT